MSDEIGPHGELEEATVASLQAEMTAGRLSARRLVEQYLERIAALDRAGPTLRSIIEVNPDALEIAEALDRERARERAARPAAWHPDPAERQHRHRRQNGHDGWLTGAGSASQSHRTPSSPPGCARQARSCWARRI